MDLGVCGTMTGSNDLTLFGLPSESSETGEKRVSAFKIKDAPLNWSPASATPFCFRFYLGKEFIVNDKKINCSRKKRYKTDS